MVFEATPNAHKHSVISHSMARRPLAPCTQLHVALWTSRAAPPDALLQLRFHRIMGTKPMGCWRPRRRKVEDSEVHFHDACTTDSGLRRVQQRTATAVWHSRRTPMVGKLRKERSVRIVPCHVSYYLSHQREGADVARQKCGHL